MIFCQLAVHFWDEKDWKRLIISVKVIWNPQKNIFYILAVVFCVSK